jgi:hypothetical protein
LVVGLLGCWVVGLLGALNLFGAKGELNLFGDVILSEL